jgi:DNA modification methylase
MPDTSKQEETAIFTYGDITLYRGDYNKVITLRNYFDLIVTSPPYNIGSKCPKLIGRRRFGGMTENRGVL